MSDKYFEAAAAWEKFCEGSRMIWQQPSEACSSVGRKYVHLNNAHGQIAKYDMSTQEFVNVLNSNELMEA